MRLRLWVIAKARPNHNIKPKELWMRLAMFKIWSLPIIARPCKMARIVESTLIPANKWSYNRNRNNNLKNRIINKTNSNSNKNKNSQNGLRMNKLIMHHKCMIKRTNKERSSNIMKRQHKENNSQFKTLERSRSMSCRALDL